MTTESKSLGNWGEQFAAELLIKKGYTIRERNFRFARGEIDLIAEHEGMLVFVEVKTASKLDLGDPLTWVDERKQRQLATVASHYLQKYEIEDVDCRFDVIAIVRQGGKIQVKHIENAFWLP